VNFTFIKLRVLGMGARGARGAHGIPHSLKTWWKKVEKFLNQMLFYEEI
jgi:hypothetical protein